MSEAPSLSISRLDEHAQMAKCVLLREVPDSAGANLKKTALPAAKLGPQTFLAAAGCCARRFHRVICNIINEDQLVAEVHSVQFVCQAPAHYAKMLCGVCHLVDAELAVAHGPPKPEWVCHTKAIATHTTFRNRDFVRGRLEKGSS